MKMVADLIARTVGRATSSKRADPSADGDGDIRRVNLAMFAALGASSVMLLLTGWKADSVGPTFLWGISCIAAGAATGFLFGIPRVGRLNGEAKASGEDSQLANVSLPAQAADAQRASSLAADYSMRPNTNLEEVSDWLTKIIVGLGLVHLRDIEGIVQRTAQNAAAAIAANPDPQHISTATALIVGLAIVGFFGGYIYTRLFLQGAFARSDAQLNGVRARIESAVARVPIEELTDSQQGSMPSPAQRKAATEVERIAADDPRAAIEKMTELASEYERVRTSMPSGAERTRLMTGVAGRMSVVALGAESDLSKFSASSRPGERLAAVVILKMRFDPNYSRWLAERLVEDAPFIGFHSASALLAGSRLVGGSQLEVLRVAVAAANKALEAKGWKNDPSRDRLIDQILVSAPPVSLQP